MCGVVCVALHSTVYIAIYNIGNSTFIMKCSVYDINLIKNLELKKYCEQWIASEDVYM